ncbi:MAG: prepilin-type N-terminal cleavage/methylation domain-containing protein [Candidatus Omnitrophica bacterium]|nr:prepilin-type N-terminal cleavage/methylation domain-containing protein [Candidatus Omnitrophota bacterium]
MEKCETCHSSKGGFTLVEMMITVGIFLIVIGAMHQVFVGGQKAWDSDMSLLEIQQSTRRGIYSITREMRAASRSSVTMAGGCDHVSSPESCTQVIFDTPSESNIQFFYDSGANQLIRQDSSANQIILASNISDVYFCCAHGDGDCSCNATYDILDVQLQAEKNAWGRTLDFSLKTKVKIRND